MNEDSKAGEEEPVEKENEYRSHKDRKPYLTKEDLSRIKEGDKEKEEKGGGLEEKVDNLVRKGESAVGEVTTAAVYIGTLAAAGAILVGGPAGIIGGTILGTYGYWNRKKKQRQKKNGRAKEAGKEEGEKSKNESNK